jgi:drug/metabolite transporter (DMT)-like permease
LYALEWWFVRQLQSAGGTTFELLYFRNVAIVFWLALYLGWRGECGSGLGSLTKKSSALIGVFALNSIVGNYAYFEAIRATTVLNASIIMQGSVFLSILGGAYFFREVITQWFVLLVLIAFGGLLLLLYQPNALSLSLGVGELWAGVVACTLSLGFFLVKWTSGVSVYFRLFAGAVLVLLILTIGALAT